MRAPITEYGNYLAMSDILVLFASAKAPLQPAEKNEMEGTFVIATTIRLHSIAGSAIAGKLYRKKCPISKTKILISDK